MPPGAVAPNNSPAPTVDYATAYNEVGNQFAAQLGQIQTQQQQALEDKNTALAQLGQTKTTNLSALDQAKANAFKNDALTSNARGLLYSGYTPYTNDQYVQNSYNPNVAKVNTAYDTGVQQTNTNYDRTAQSLQDKIAQINQDRANAANTLVLNTQSQQAADAKAAAAAAKASGPTEAQQKQTFSNASLQYLRTQMGGDAHVSPETYAQEAIKWIKAGYSIADLNSAMQSAKLFDPKNGYYQYALNEALKRSK